MVNKRVPEVKPGAELMTAGQVAEKLCISIRTLWRMVAANKIPQPIRYNRKLTRWKKVDIDKYVASL